MKSLDKVPMEKFTEHLTNLIANNMQLKSSKSGDLKKIKNFNNALSIKSIF